jgi:hypothetical protein
VRSLILALGTAKPPRHPPLCPTAPNPCCPTAPLPGSRATPHTNAPPIEAGVLPNPNPTGRPAAPPPRRLAASPPRRPAALPPHRPATSWVLPVLARPPTKARVLPYSSPIGVASYQSSTVLPNPSPRHGKATPPTCHSDTNPTRRPTALPPCCLTALLRPHHHAAWLPRHTAHRCTAYPRRCAPQP